MSRTTFLPFSLLILIASVVACGLLLVAGSAARAQDAPLPILTDETVLFQGDSITDMARGRTDDPNHILGHGYPFLIAARYGSAYPERRVTFLNRGCSGDTVGRLAERWDQDALAHHPDVLSVLIGINDVHVALDRGAPFPTDDFFESYDAILAAARRANPRVKLVLCEPFILDVGMVAKDPARWHESVAAVQAVVERLALKYDAPLVHFQRVLDEAVKRAPAAYWVWDGIHPTYAGQQLLADEWMREYGDFYLPALQDPRRNTAIAPAVNGERDSYNWLHRHADVLAEQPKSDPQIVLIGDSITHFWGGAPRAKQSHGAASWEATFGDVPALNMGFGWDRTQNVLWRLNHGELEGIQPKAIVLNIGTNNLAEGGIVPPNTPEETAAGIEAILDILKQRAPSSRIVVMGVFPRGFEPGNPLDTKIQELNALLSQSLKEDSQVTFLDLGERLRASDGSISRENFFDGTHLTEKAYQIWGAALRDCGAIPEAK